MVREPGGCDNDNRQTQDDPAHATQRDPDEREGGPLHRSGGKRLIPIRDREWLCGSAHFWHKHLACARVRCADQVGPCALVLVAHIVGRLIGRGHLSPRMVIVAQLSAALAACLLRLAVALRPR